MDTLTQQFNDRVTAVRKATIDFKPNNTQKLKLYAFYKQAIQGDITGECPSAIKMVERAKWMAWNAIKGTSNQEAMTGYLEVFEE